MDPSSSSEQRPAKIKTSHLERRAEVYVRQSTNEQMKDHPGSIAAQREQMNFARRWGWPEAQIYVNEIDLGLSGTSTSDRRGFLEMLARVSRGEVGMVLAIAVDRLNRKTGDFINLAETAAETSTLICINGVIYDPASEDLSEMLTLQVQGMFGAFDNRLRAQRLMAARTARARQGIAVSPPPTGYIRSVRGAWVKDPDRSVQDAIQRVFALYLEVGSLGKIVAYFRQHSLEFPRRLRGQLRWGPLDAALVHSLLHNPSYCGDYVFLRRQSKKRPGTNQVTIKLRSSNDWIVTHDHHEAYVSRDTWRQIQERLAAHRPKFQRLIGKGHALLQGLVRCNVDGCYEWMKTRYWGRDGVARTADYTCLRTNGWRDVVHKVTFPARFIDRAVVEHVLTAIAAISPEAARAVIAQSQLEHATLERTHRRRLLDAEEDVQRIRQLLLNLPGEFQHARIDVMREFEAALQRHRELKLQIASETVPSLSVTIENVSELVDRTRDIRRLWMRPQRTNDERKRLLRTVIAEVIVNHADRQMADIEIVWKTGLREPLRVLRSRGVAAVVRDLTVEGKSAQHIADELNAAGAVTAAGRPISKPVVTRKQGQYGLRLKDERRQARQIIRRGLLDHRPRPQILTELQAQVPRLGPWDSRRLSEAIRQLRRGVAAIDPLPAMLPAEQEKQRVLDMVQQAIAAGSTWVKIAIALNEAGLRPPRGSAFTPVQVRLLFLRARGLRSFKLPARPSAPRRSRA